MPETTSPLTPQQLMDAFAVPGRPNVFVLGCGERRITFIAQQIRALNLVEALVDAGRVSPNSRVGIVGAGIAGLSFALHAAEYGARCTVLESATELWPLQRGCSSRWLHPYIYDWPAPGWFRSEARLPKLGWRAGIASAVTRKLEHSWSTDRSAHRVNLQLGIEDPEISPGAIDGRQSLSWRERRSSGWRAQRTDVDLVLLALGFGVEAASLYSSPYWKEDALQQITEGVVFVSGCGDGGLTDALRVCLRDFDYPSLTWLASMRELAQICQQVGAVEADLTRYRDPKAITEAYSQFHIPPKAEREIRSKIRPRVKVILNDLREAPLSRDSSPLSRLLVSFLLDQGRIEFFSGRIPPDGIQSDYSPLRGTKYVVTLDNRGQTRQHVVDRVVLRHGPEQPSPLERAFPDIWNLLEQRRILYRTQPEESDRTRFPLSLLLREITRTENASRDGFPLIERTALSDDLLARLRDGYRIVNVFGHESNGKTRLLFDFKKRLRNSAAFVDCFFPPDVGFEGVPLYRRILARIGGGIPGNSGDTLEAAVAAVREQIESNRRVVFLIDDLRDSNDDSPRGTKLMKRLLQFEGTAVVCSSRKPLTDLRALDPRSCSLEVPPFTATEARQYIEQAKVVSERTLEEAVERLSDSQGPRSPSQLRHLVIALSLDPTNVKEAFDRAAQRPLELSRNEIIQIFGGCDINPQLAYSLAAPRSLTVPILQVLSREVLGTPLTFPPAQRLLTELLDSNHVRAFDGKYWPEPQFIEALTSTARPEPYIYRALLAHQMEELRTDRTLPAAIDALAYLEQSVFSSAEAPTIEAGVVRTIDECLPEDITLPENLTLERILAAAQEPPLRRRYIRYLEGRGRYVDALGAFPSESDDVWLRLRIRDKLADFAKIDEELQREIHARKLPTIPSTAWPAQALFYRGRSLQAAGSLSQALSAYELIEQLGAAAPTIYRIHALIEAATIFVFAENPQAALISLTRAEALAESGDTYLRQRADIMRYRARAQKLAVVHDPSRADFAEVERSANEASKLASQLRYEEGIIWANVVHGRIAYFRRDHATATMFFQRAADAIILTGYRGAEPHLDRHWALLHAAQGDFDRALARLASARTAAKRDGRQYLLALLSDTEAKVHAVGGRWEEARRAIQMAQLAYEGVGLLQCRADLLSARLAAATRDPSTLLTSVGPW